MSTVPPVLPVPPAVTATTSTGIQPCPCNSWYCWLQSWASPGGNLILLTFLSVIFVGTMIFLMVRYGPAAPVVITIAALASTFAGAITTRMGITNSSSSITTTRTPDQH